MSLQSNSLRTSTGCSQLLRTSSGCSQQILIEGSFWHFFVPVPRPYFRPVFTLFFGPFWQRNLQCSGVKCIFCIYSSQFESRIPWRVKFLHVPSFSFFSSFWKSQTATFWPLKCCEHPLDVRNCCEHPLDVRNSLKHGNMIKKCCEHPVDVRNGCEHNFLLFLSPPRSCEHPLDVRNF